MRRIAAAGAVLLVMVVFGGIGGAGAQTTSSSPSTTTTTTIVVTDPSVRLEAGPAQTRSFAPPCNDVVVNFPEQLSFILRRDPSTSPLVVPYRLSGSAQPGVNYEPLPGSVTFAAGASSVTVTVVPRAAGKGDIVDLTLEVTGGTALAPPPVTIKFLSPPVAGPFECGYRFTSDAWNTAQTVAVGGALHALTLEQFTPPLFSPATGVFRVVSGNLPPGVELRADGSFGGSPTTPGTSRSRIEACRPAPPGTCVTTDLAVTVALPRTGAALSVGDWAMLAALILGAGVVALLLAAPHRRPPG
ncbi:MAG: hypothetical protein ACRD12_15940 [Acidimicrobiales bacterium]